MSHALSVDWRLIYSTLLQAAHDCTQHAESLTEKKSRKKLWGVGEAWDNVYVGLQVSVLTYKSAAL